jgi:hypothetical protein
MTVGSLGTKLVNDANAQLAAKFSSHGFPVAGDEQRDFKNRNKL